MDNHIAMGINKDTSETKIISYTGTATTDVVGHFNGIQPTLVMTKSLSSPNDWQTIHIGCSIADLADKLDDKYDKEAVRKVLQDHFPEDFI
jgi:hypothetical protein